MAELRLTECFLVSAAALASLAEGGGLASLCSLDLSHMSAMQSLRVSHQKPLEVFHLVAHLLRDCPDHAALSGAYLHPSLLAAPHISRRAWPCVHPKSLRRAKMTLSVEPIIDSG